MPRPTEILYTALAVLGLVIPYQKFIPWVRENGMDWGLFLELATANDIATFISLDATMGGVAAAAFVLVEGWRLRLRAFWLVGALTLMIGACFGLPLFLWLRERHLAKAGTP